MMESGCEEVTIISIDFKTRESLSCIQFFISTFIVDFLYNLFNGEIGNTVGLSPYLTCTFHRNILPKTLWKAVVSNTLLVLATRWHSKQKLQIRVPLLYMDAWGLSEQRGCIDTISMASMLFAWNYCFHALILACLRWWSATKGMTSRLIPHTCDSTLLSR